eukprot:scaffold34585_cov60-Phaeocystis_antarctica.AAC.2
MRHLLFVAALSSSDTVRATSAPPPPSSSSATSAQSVALGVSVPREHRGRLLAHGTACPDNPTFGCIGNAINNHATCCTECAKASGGTLGAHSCNNQNWHGTAGTQWNQEQCGCSTISAVTGSPSPPPSPPPPSPPPFPPPPSHPSPSPPPPSPSPPPPSPPP